MNLSENLSTPTSRLASISGVLQPWMRFPGKFAAMVAHGSMDLVLPPSCAFCSGIVGLGQDFCDSCEPALTYSQAVMRRACIRCGMPMPRLAERETDKVDSSVVREDADSIGEHPLINSDHATSEGDCLEGDRLEGDRLEGDRLEGDRLPEQVSQRPSEASTQGQFAEPGCGHCHGQSQSFDRVIPLWIYRNTVCDAVVASKYAHNTPLANAIGTRLGATVLERLGDHLPDEVSFVPSHFTRQISRGGIGSQTVAQVVAKIIGKPVLERTRITRKIAKQAWLADDERKRNVDGAFVIRNSYAFPRPPKIADRHILLVDDVLTTGATANEMAGVLKEAGAREVTLAVVARAVRG
ncbi:ComF family protein [Rubripirellula amarantea]|nr:double zinc ribbon domain-containing protein [Rubripirellula amarantea]